MVDASSSTNLFYNSLTSDRFQPTASRNKPSGLVWIVSRAFFHCIVYAPDPVFFKFVWSSKSGDESSDDQKDAPEKCGEKEKCGHEKCRA